jgi:hypothetical protein
MMLLPQHLRCNLSQAGHVTVLDEYCPAGRKPIPAD